MTCASCVGRTEKTLRKLDGVTDARVNLATDVASITYASDLIGLDDLTRAVVKAVNCALHLIAVTQACGIGPGRDYVSKQSSRPCPPRSTTPGGTAVGVVRRHPGAPDADHVTTADPLGRPESGLSTSHLH